MLLYIGASLCCQSVRGSSFFSVQEVAYRDKVYKPVYGILQFLKPVTPGVLNFNFIPGVEAKVTTQDVTQSKGLYAKAYFFDDRGGLLATVPSPSMASRGTTDQYSMPVIFQKAKPESLFFAVPKELVGQHWRVLVVFGDSHDAAAGGYPAGIPMGIDYPERKIVEGQVVSRIDRKPALDPLIEYVVKTGNPQQPEITLLLRAPDGVTDPAEIQGVMAMCLIGNSVDAVKRQLQQIDVGDDVRNMIGFANKHKMAILCWGTGRALWNAGANYDQISKQQNQKYDQAFDQVADAWERGVKDLQKKYGLPDHNFLLVGFCVSAQWAHRLAMRKPDYFLAAYIHIPTSFDAPTPEASKILWLLTAGELDYGYVHSISFYNDCRKAGYPIIFKPIMLLGHARSTIAENLATKFFEYALTVKDQREAYDKVQKEPLTRISSNVTTSKVAWLGSFRNPQYYGDYLNQECYPANQVDMIPDALRVPLPTKELADFWNK